MAPPPAAKNFQQHQPITTGLRIICESYPSNTCLRELLQNADDAGATEIEYVLDTNTYAHSPLLHNDLAEYHGPALLARNNSVFTDEDFVSLSKVGDSRKRHDVAATGKFGQGFNSVYHWTDGPWVYSRCWLLFLDPHQRWSRDTQEPGGPAWDVIANSDCLEIDNHLKTFEAFKIDRTQAIDATIIRIPLRTQAQAKISEIVQQEITVEHIKNDLEHFANEIREGGLLFLKHIRKVIIRIDNNVVLTAQILGTNKRDSETREQLPKDFVNLYASSTIRATQDLFRIFEIAIEYTTKEEHRVYNYVVQHAMMASSGNEEMNKWARERKLFPWVAIAAPLIDSSVDYAFRGRLFSTLRLPILTHQPVHIHGLFSIAPDRARLSSSGQSPGYDDLATKWNQYLFTHCVSTAWVKVLVHQSSIASGEDNYGLWPRADLSRTDVWSTLDDGVIDLVIKDNLPVWRAVNGGCVTFDQGYFSYTDRETEKYATSLAQANFHVVYLAGPLFLRVKERAACLARNISLLIPGEVRDFLRKEGTSSKSTDACAELLEYCLLDARKSDLGKNHASAVFADLRGIAIWPTVSGLPTEFPDIQPLFLPRDQAEMQLFMKSQSLRTLDIDRLSRPVFSIILDNITDLASLIKFRTVSDLSIDWPSMYPLAASSNRSNDFPRRLKGLDHLISSIWLWIDARLKEEKLEKFPSSLHDQMLLPINNSRIRRLGAKEDVFPTLIVEKSDLLAEFLLSATSRNPEAAPPVLDTRLLTPKAVKLLCKKAKAAADLNMTCVDNLECFLMWLAGSKKLLVAASLQERDILLKHLERQVRNQSHSEQLTRKIARWMKRLPIFKKIKSVAPFEQRFPTLCDLDQDGHLFEAPPGFPPMPDIPGISFYEPSDPSEIYLIRQLQLLEETSTQDLLIKHLLPWMQDAQDPLMLPAKDALVSWIFDNSKNPTKNWISSVMTWPIVPLAAHDGVRIYRYLGDLVDPSSRFASLYFAEENVFPCPDFVKRHKGALAACGLGNGVHRSTPLERAAYYSGCGADLHVLQDKVKCLLGVPIELEPSFPETLISEIRTSRWLPGVLATGEMTLLSPSACRGPDHSQLVDLVWGIVPYSVSKDWKKLLGWDQSVPKEVLFQQLDLCLKNLDYERVDSLLSNMESGYIPGLRSKPCILGSHGNYFPPDRVFLTGSRLTAHPLAPYLDEVDGGFAKKHANILVALDVKSEPSIEDIQYVQGALEVSNEGQLSEKDLSIAIATLEVATLMGYGPSNFSIPDRMSIFRALPDIVYGDPNVNGGIADFNFTHARVSEDLIHRLGVENSFARATRLAIDFEDEDEDEYAPREKLSNIIKDTLGRYPIETTFNEFLANADDAGATKISWTIDECGTGPYESQSLLTNDLATFQGPALMVYNDGIFSENDFAGFKEIGQGGKLDDATTTGMFGRGVMSMYHFTDVPMIISGGFYVILDPQQEYLPRNRHWKRKIGVKIALSTARRVAEGQLLPFHGLYGYDKSQDHYNGTIFRFPFRESGRQTTLKDSLRHISPSTTRSLLEDYFHTARISLLFLTNVTHVEFCVRGQTDRKWCVSAHRSEDSEDEVFRQVTITNAKVDHKSMRDIWRVGITDIEQSPPSIVKIGKGSSKITECGIAACLQRGVFESIPNNKAGDHKVALPHAGKEKSWKIYQKVFCKLPTSSESQLPVSFHASFAITGDRKTIAFEDQSELAVWNHWLLTKCLPGFYLDFLKDLSPRLGQEAFDLWPSRSLTATSATLSSTVAKAFWGQIMDPEHIAYQLYPTIDQENSVLTQGANDLRRAKQRKTRKLHPVTSLTNAQFDFLPPEVSLKLRPLFQALLVNLVRPPAHISSALKDASSDLQIVQLNSDRLAEIFQNEANCVYLENFLSQIGRETDKMEMMATLLELLIPVPLGEDMTSLKILHGCRVLPRPSLDAPLGLLAWEPQSDSQWNLVATTEEQKLFDFASGSMVNTGMFSRSATSLKTGTCFLRRNPITELIETPLNVRKLEIDHLGSLLARLDSPSAPGSSSKFRDGWMPMLWNFINIKFKALMTEADLDDSTSFTIDSLLSKANLWDQPIYRYHDKKQWQYLTTRKFSTEACIVGPNLKQQQDMCALIPGLKCLDSACFPSPLGEAESDLSKLASFERFLGALQMNEKKQNVVIKRSLNDALSAEAKETLRNLVLKYLKNRSTSELVSDKTVLQTLPIWPCFQRSNLSHIPKHVAAEDAYFCKHSTLFMPWVKNLGNFVEPQIVKTHETLLLKLKLPLMSAEKFWQHIKKDLPPQIASASDVERFLILIKYLAKEGIKLSGNVAPNGAGLLCKANSLYDHEEEIFKAAFWGEESSHFLHPDLRSLRPSWLSAGLRSPPPSAVVSKEDYLQCALAIDRQWTPSTSNEPFDQNAKVVSKYLQFDRSDFSIWPESYWNQISKVRMFQVKGNQDDQPVYRKTQMRQIAQEHTHCALKDAGRNAHLRVSWSQVKFLKNPPAAGVWEKFPGGGSPSIGTVYKHLQFLIGLCKEVSQHDLQEYLKDVQACYDRLQNDAASKNLPGISEAKIFFNMDTTQIEMIYKPDVEASLTTVKLLCLNSPVDPLPMRVTRKFLVPYERLLSVLGCKSIVQPPAAASVLSFTSTGYPMSEAMSKIKQLRDEGQLIDVIFEAEGTEKHAHKIFLVAVSDYCMIKFSGEWGRLSERGEHVSVEGIRFGTLSTMVDFAYTGEFVEPQLKDPKDENEVADVLDELLDLLDGTDLWQLARLHDMVENFLLSTSIVPIYVRPDNVKEVKERAENSRALRLVKHCRDFIAANAWIDDTRLWKQ